MRRLVLLVVAIVAGFAGVATIRAQESPPLDELVARATEAFRRAGEVEGHSARRAAYAEAAATYAQAIDTGHQSAALEYNAGNAWFLAGDLGAAILHYRRGLLLRPGDPEITANLETARAARIDQIESDAGTAITETVFFWHRGLSLRVKWPVTLAAWTLAFGLFSIAFLVLRGKPSARTCRRAGYVAVFVALALGTSSAIELAERAAREDGVVLADSVELRTGDGNSYPARYENPIHAGTEVRLVEERAGWVEITLPDGKSGWVPAEAVERL